MRTPSTFSTVGLVFSLIVLGVAFVLLSLFNPALPDYQLQVLAPIAQARHSASDAVLSSILQSISLPGKENTGEESPNPVTLLVNRTTRSNYVVFSVYTTEFDYCDGNSARAVGRTLAIAGRFYTIEKGDCSPGHRG